MAPRCLKAQLPEGPGGVHRWGSMDTPQLLEVVSQALVNVAALALAVIHLARSAKRHEDSQD